MNLSKAKLEQLDAAATFRVYGDEIDLGTSSRARATSAGRWIAIGPCFCVHDSPESPCPCMSDGFWWLRRDAVVRQGSAGRKGHDGKDLQYFDVLLDSTIMVESVQPVSARALKGLGS